MDLDVFLSCPRSNCGKDINKIVKSFTTAGSFYVREVQAELAKTTDNGEIWKIHVEINNDLVGPEHYEQLTHAFRNRLYALGLRAN